MGRHFGACLELLEVEMYVSKKWENVKRKKEGHGFFVDVTTIWQILNIAI